MLAWRQPAANIGAPYRWYYLVVGRRFWSSFLSEPTLYRILIRPNGNSRPETTGHIGGLLYRHFFTCQCVHETLAVTWK